VLPNCEWLEGKGETISNDLGVQTQAACVKLCFEKNRDLDGVNGASYGTDPGIPASYETCLCVYTHAREALLNSTNDERAYKTCIFPIPGKNSLSAYH